ncbi:unnamed protein product [Paramecium primaurelia]|uniref:ADP-ribosylation factor n=2 Tax=Paramecium TaxID=5884 RepID=A0A8S1SE48_9CILI|nr:unnamed protein product [Paramecium primaurelia]CAD8137737.1 unnamed protein product [Paramecium pentaurelia]
MGNNHEKFFSKEKRKLLVLGLNGVGKSTLIKTLNQGNYQDKKEDLQIVDIKLKNITLCVFDMGGSERQRIFWRQNFYGSQGVIYVIDGNIDIQKALLELEKIIIDSDLKDTPIAVFVNQNGKDNPFDKTEEFLKNKTRKVSVFKGSTLEYKDIMNCIEWLGKEMKPI